MNRRQFAHIGPGLAVIGAEKNRAPHNDALSLIEFAQVRSDRVSATARAMLWTIRACLLALTGRSNEAVSDVDRADACFADRDPSADPPWLCYYDDAEHQAVPAKL
jgi:hypothetical protein